MISWVAELSAKAVGSDNVFVATDSERIAAIVQQAGFHVVMTTSTALTGTDRVAEERLQLLPYWLRRREGNRWASLALGLSRLLARGAGPRRRSPRCP